jgi:hypothetical protein
MKHLRWLVVLSLFAVLAGAETVSAQVRRTTDARANQQRAVVTQQATTEDDAWHASFDPIVTNLISLDDQIRAMEVKLNDIGRMTDRSAQLLAVRDFEKAALDKEAEALRVGLDLIAKADTFLPTADRTNETREKTVLVIETKLLLIITRVVQIKSTIIIIKESRVPPWIPPVPVASTTTAPAANQRQ